MGRQVTLAQLLNDESFLRWLRKTASVPEQQEWEQWLLEDERHEILVKKAQKIIRMPFKKTTPEPDGSNEWLRFKENLP